MHSIEASDLVRHGRAPGPAAILGKSLRALSIANANGEVGIGGDVGRTSARSSPPRAWAGGAGAGHLYGEYADTIVATAQRAPDSEQTDQVQVVCPSGFHPRADLRLGRDREARHVQQRLRAGERRRSIILPRSLRHDTANDSIQANRACSAPRAVRPRPRRQPPGAPSTSAQQRRSIGTVPPSAVSSASWPRVQQSRSLLVAAANRFAALERPQRWKALASSPAVRNLRSRRPTPAVRIATAR